MIDAQDLDGPRRARLRHRQAGDGQRKNDPPHAIPVFCTAARPAPAEPKAKRERPPN